IWQTVWLEPVPVVHIESLRIETDVDKESVEVNLIGVGLGGEISIKCPDGSVIKDSSRTSRTFTSRIKPQLWSPEQPILYELTATIYDLGGKPQDSVSGYFAFRKISLGKDDKGITRLMLNNKPYFMVGPLDQGFWPDGLYTAPTDEALKYDIEVTKK